MSKTYTGPTPFNISISDKGETTINVAENEGILLGPLGGDYAKTHTDALALAKQQVAVFLATISAGGPIASLTKLNLNLKDLYTACDKYYQSTFAGMVGDIGGRNENVKNIIRLCAAEANVAFPVAGGTDTQTSRDAISPLVDGTDILAKGDSTNMKIALAVAAFYNIRKSILSELAKPLPAKSALRTQPGSNILKLFTVDATATLPTDLTVAISSIKTVIALVKDAIENNKSTLNISTNTANKKATDAKKDAAAKKAADDAADAKKLADDAAKKLVENKKNVAQKYIDDNFTVVQDNGFEVAAAAADPAADPAAAADIATVLPITTLKAAVRTLATTGTPDTLPGGVTYVAAKTVVDDITAKLAGAGGGALPLSPLLITAKAWFDAYAIVALAAKNAADAVLVGGARKNTRRRSYSHGGRRKSYRRRRY